MESSRQGAHDRMTPTAVSGVTLAVSLAVPLAVSGVSYFPSSLKRFQAFLMASGHISASFHLQRSNEGPLKSSRQGAHDRMIPTAISGVTLTVSLAVPLAVSGVSYCPSSLMRFQAFLMAPCHISASFHL